MIVYIMLYLSKTYTEVLGVYSSYETAKDFYKQFTADFTGSSDFDSLKIISRELVD